MVNLRGWAVGGERVAGNISQTDPAMKHSFFLISSIS